MSDALPPPPPMGSVPAFAGSYPARFDVHAPLKVARWRWFAHWIMAFPHIVVLFVVMIPGFFALVWAWLVALFTGRTPEGPARFLAGLIRYQYRLTAFAMVMTEDYPPIAFTSSLEDPGDYPAVVIDFDPIGEHARLLVLFRWFASLPHVFILYFVQFAASVVLFLAFFAALFTGSWPEGMRRFVVGAMRWQFRLAAWGSMLTSPYPPFSTT